MKSRYVIGAIIIALAIGASVYLLSESQIQYTTITYARTAGKKVQIKGKWVQRDQATYDQSANTFRFILQDEEGTTIPVVYRGAKPNNFELAEAVVVRGRINGATFEASDILTKCPSKYEGRSPLQTQLP
ncbi:MAG: cytochrome C biogenesis protein CcmE [Candidatus Kapaibacterium sp.]|nr:MAG: cytochrome C biogenesis protein CcmE [Candidatus Kapabacteria bacterium]